MLPIPTIDYIPRLFKDKSDSETISLTNKMDEYILSVLEEVKGLDKLLDIEQCPAKFLDYLGYIVNAGILQGDGETTKRTKIAGAIEAHKKAGSWEYQVKLIVDSIAGYDSRIFHATDADDWIMCGDGITEEGVLWGMMEGEGEDPFGLALSGAGDELEIWGNIYIDCHYGIYTAVLTSDQIEQIVASIAEDIAPAYFKVYLGYRTSATIGFTVYTGGTIE